MSQSDFDVSPLDERVLKTGHGGTGLGPSYSVALALSGGGHRAALFGLGVVMAMRDAGKVPHQISSVSGGSITNAVLAQAYFARVDRPRDSDCDDARWQEATEGLFKTIVEKGILTTGWLRALVFLLVAPPVALLILGLADRLPPWYVTTALVAVWAVLVLLRGLLIERLITKRCFGALGRVHLENLINTRVAPENAVDHVICCTDLVTGQPFYVSNRSGGETFRRLEDVPQGVGPRNLPSRDRAREIDELGIFFRTPRLPVGLAVRASAGFPGIPPRRLALARMEPTRGVRREERASRSVAFLSDGGIWNNLATQPFQDGYLWGPYGPWVVVVADASAPVPPDSPALYHLPLIAEIRALVRQVTILNGNTVGPRRAEHHDWIRRELISHRTARFGTERLYPVVSCLERPEELLARLSSAVHEEDWNLGFLDDVERTWREERRRPSQARAAALRGEETRDHDAGHVDPDARAHFLRLSALSSVDGEDGPDDPVATYPTTLDRVDGSVARAIVFRGYTNAATMMYLTGISDRLPLPSGWLAETVAQTG